MAKRRFMTKVNLATKNLPITLLRQQEDIGTEEGDSHSLKHHGGCLQLREKLHCHPRVVETLTWGY